MVNAYNAVDFLTGLFSHRGDGPQDLAAPANLAMLQPQADDVAAAGLAGDDPQSPATAPRCPVCGSSRRVSGLRSVWCRDCADQGRETELGDAQPQEAAGGDECGDDPQDKARAGGHFGDAGGLSIDLQPPVVTVTGPAPWTLPPWPPLVDPRIIAATIPDCRTCGRPAVIPGQPGRLVGLCFECWQENECDIRPRTSANAKG